jgi:hypothetical protein
MVLVDTSVWIDYFLKGNVHLKRLLIQGELVCHPLVVGELACGYIKNRSEILLLLGALPQAKTAEDSEGLYFIQERQIMGQGVGIVDVHLLASALLTHAPLWTNNKQLQKITRSLDLFYKAA